MDDRACPGKVVARTDELAHGATKKFVLECREGTLEGLVVSYEGAYYAYINRCCHLPMPMDWVENDFFSLDKRYLICSTHGATYEPTTGECIWGPCYGGFLEPVPLDIRDGKIRAFCPQGRDRG